MKYHVIQIIFEYILFQFITLCWLCNAEIGSKIFLLIQQIQWIIYKYIIHNIKDVFHIKSFFYFVVTEIFHIFLFFFSKKNFEKEKNFQKNESVMQNLKNKFLKFLTKKWKLKCN